jgi:hypothetical protein
LSALESDKAEEISRAAFRRQPIDAARGDVMCARERRYSRLLARRRQFGLSGKPLWSSPMSASVRRIDGLEKGLDHGVVEPCNHVAKEQSA